MQATTSSLLFAKTFSSISTNSLENLASQKNLTPLILNLQQKIIKQQEILNLLLIQTQYQSQNKQETISQNHINTDSKIYDHISYNYQSPQSQEQNICMDYCPTYNYGNDLTTFNTDDIQVKEENGSLEINKSEPSIETSAFSTYETITENDTEEASPEKLKPFKIIRRNDFKTDNKVRTREVTTRKCNKSIIPKHPPPKAKHLWINYGRKIIYFALSQTKDEGKARIKQLVGRLNVKKDFETVFGVKPTDSEHEKIFKILFGKIALFFIHYKAEETFKNSNYRDHLISQKHVVSSYISTLIGTDCLKC